MPTVLVEGKVPIPLLRIYQSNMVLHLQAHLHAPPLSPPPTTQAAPAADSFNDIPHTWGICTQILSPADAVLHTPPTTSDFPISTTPAESAELHSMSRLYAALSQVACLKAEIHELHAALTASATTSPPLLLTLPPSHTHIPICNSIPCKPQPLHNSS